MDHEIWNRFKDVLNFENASGKVVNLHNSHKNMNTIFGANTCEDFHKNLKRDSQGSLEEVGKIID